MKPLDLTAVKALSLPKIAQLGFVVKDIHETLPIFATIYNLNTWYKPNYTERRQIIQNEAKDLEVDLLLGYSGSIQVELIQGNGKESDFYEQQIQMYGEGLHHLGFYISDLEKKLRLIQELKIQVLFSVTLKTVGGGTAKYVYLDTVGMCGTILELIEVRLYGISVPQTQFFMNIGVLTGDVTKVKVSY
jgi:hypothetical protein